MTEIVKIHDSIYVYKVLFFVLVFHLYGYHILSDKGIYIWDGNTSRNFLDRQVHIFVSL